MRKPPLSVALITFNEEDVLGKTLEAIKDIAEEIVVVDSHSTDRTVEIAKSYGAKVYVEDWKGYAQQKNSALEKCTQEWILFLDADEVVSEELKESIVKELQAPKADGYMINRRTYYMGKFLKHTWQPEWRLRLVKRTAEPKWVGNIHERLEIKSRRVAKLKGDLYHFSYKSLFDHAYRTVKLTHEIAANTEHLKDPSFFDLFFRPIWAFVRTLLLKKGFMDGYAGLIVSFMTMFYTFLKYAFLYEIKLKRKLGSKVWRNEDTRS